MIRTRRIHVLVAVMLILGVISLGSWTPCSLVQAADKKEPPQIVEEESITAGVRAVVEDAKALIVAPLHMDREDALKAGAALAVVGGLIAVDHPIRDFTQRNTSPTGKNVADGFGTFGSATTLAGVNAGLLVIGYATESSVGGSKLKESAWVSLEAEAFAVAATSLLKEVTGRYRPDSNRGATYFRPFTGLNTSFASTSAAASFAVATVFAERYEGPVGWVAYGLAAVVSGSRLYADKHFASDVVAGSLIGWGMGHFLNRRHGANPDDWQVRPMAMEQGLGGGIMVGKRF